MTVKTKKGTAANGADEPKPKGKKAETGKIELERPDERWVEIELVGTSPLISNRFGPTAQGEMEVGMTTTAAEKKTQKKNRQPLDPQQKYLESMHICHGSYTKAMIEKNLYGFPAVGLKKAIGNGAYRFGGYKNKVDIISVLFVHGPYDGLIPLYSTFAAGKRKARSGSSALSPCVPVCRRDLVVLPNNKASLAYRGQFNNWKTVVQIRYWPAVMTLESLINGLLMAGRYVGIGGWRVEKGGDSGMFEVGKIIELPLDYQPVRYSETTVGRKAA